MGFRFGAIFPILLSITAFVLSLLVMLAGKNTKFLSDVYVLRVNTTNIGHATDINALFSHLGVDATEQSQVSHFLQSIQESGIDVSEVVSTAAHNLGLQDAYSAHVLTWCEGTDVTNNVTRITACTKPKIPFSFDPVQILQDELLNGIQLSDLGFPTQDIKSVTNTLQKAYKAMGICYLIGTILAGISIFTGMAGFFRSRILESLNSVVLFLGMNALGLASAIATVIAIKAKNVFNKKAKDTVGVEAYNSSKFLGMTWAAVGLMLLASLLWCGICCCGSHERSSNGEKNTKIGYRDEKRARRWSFRRKASL